MQKQKRTKTMTPKSIIRKPTTWIPILCVVLTAGFAWMAWATVTIANSVPEEVLDKHKEQNTDQHTQLMQQIIAQGVRIEEKLDDIQRDVNGNRREYDGD
jgi:hypothetical protein